MKVKSHSKYFGHLVQMAKAYVKELSERQSNPVAVEAAYSENVAHLVKKRKKKKKAKPIGKELSEGQSNPVSMAAANSKNGHLVKLKKKKRKTKAIGKALSERQTNPVPVAAAYSENGHLVKLKKKKRKAKAMGKELSERQSNPVPMAAAFSINGHLVKLKKKTRKAKAAGKKLSERQSDPVAMAAANSENGHSVKMKKKKRKVKSYLEKLSESQSNPVAMAAVYCENVKLEKKKRKTKAIGKELSERQANPVPVTTAYSVNGKCIKKKTSKNKKEKELKERLMARLKVALRLTGITAPPPSLNESLSQGKCKRREDQKKGVKFCVKSDSVGNKKKLKKWKKRKPKAKQPNEGRKPNLGDLVDTAAPDISVEKGEVNEIHGEDSEKPPLPEKECCVSAESSSSSDLDGSCASTPKDSIGTDISVKKGKMDEIHGEDLEKPPLPEKEFRVSAESSSSSDFEDSCASTSKDSVGTDISVRNGKINEIHGEDLEKPPPPEKKRHVSAKDSCSSDFEDSCASTSKDSVGTVISVRKGKMNEIHREDLGKPPPPEKKRRVCAVGSCSSELDGSCASTSKHSDGTEEIVRKYRPAQIVEDTDDFTEEQRKTNEYVAAGKYLPTLSECLCTDFGGEKRPYIPRFAGDPICPYCHQLFRSISYLDLHVQRVHFNIKKFKCDWCGKRFGEKVTLKAHELIHLDATPYTCKYCDKTFRYSTHKCAHMRTHMRNWSTIVDAIEFKRRDQKRATAEKVKKKLSKKDIVEDCLENDDDIIASIINTQTETINVIKESFA